MSPRVRSTFAKRQKEQARQEKQKAKAQRRFDKKNRTSEPGTDDNLIAADGQAGFADEVDGESSESDSADERENV